MILHEVQHGQQGGSTISSSLPPTPNKIASIYPDQTLTSTSEQINQRQ